MYHGDSDENLLRFQVFQFGWPAPLVKEKYSPLPDRNTGVLLEVLTFVNVKDRKYIQLRDDRVFVIGCEQYFSSGLVQIMLQSRAI